jgi:hypothetical protein
MTVHHARTFRTATPSAVFLLLMFAGVSRPCLANQTNGDTSKKSDAASSTQKDQVDLSLTIYNSNLALVRDIRRIQLKPGTFQLRFEDVAASIDPATVQFRSLADPAKLSIVEQNFEYNSLDPQKLLQSYVGRQVTLVQREQEAGSTKWVQTKALLLADTSGPVWKIGDEIVTGMAADSYRFPDLPAELYSKPTLLWTLDNRGPDAQRVEASYLTGNMNWTADYALNVGSDGKSAGFDGWVTLTNNSGAAYNDAKLQLVAGEIHRAAVAGRYMPQDMALAKAAAAPSAQFEQQAFSEYHLYTLQRRTSIANNDSKQISLLATANVPVEKYWVVEGQPFYYRNPQGIGEAIPEPVKVFYRFKNEQKAGLGMPLPGGTVRVYQTAADGAAQFIGEDTINHTPKDETVRVNIGDAFDVVCERKQTDYKRIANNAAEMEYEITLRNHKDSAVTVEVREPVGGTWEVESANYKWTKLDASTIGFEIPVDQGGSATLDYRVRVKW